MTVRSRNHDSRRAFFYACSSFHHRGKAVCTNSMEMRLADADNAVLTALEREPLDPEIIQEAMRRAIASVNNPAIDPARRRAAIASAMEQVGAELGALTAAIVTGGEVATLVAAIGERERRRDTLARELAELDRPRVRPSTRTWPLGIVT
jgi:hypothetical protein